MVDEVATGDAKVANTVSGRYATGKRVGAKRFTADIDVSEGDELPASDKVPVDDSFEVEEAIDRRENGFDLGRAR